MSEEKVIHISARAIEWLTKATTYYGVSYTSPVGLRACHKYPREQVPLLIPPVPEEWRCGQPVCGTEDMRAMYLANLTAQVDGKPLTGRLTVVQSPSKNFGMRSTLRPTVRPTCMECRVLLDACMERGVPGKYDSFLHPVEDLGMDIYWAKLRRVDNQWRIKLGGRA